MQQILEPYSIFQKVCGMQKKSDTVTAFSMLVFQVPCKDGMLLYHTLSGELLLLSKQEYSACLSSGELKDYLFSHWFVVEQSLDEYQMAVNFRKISSMFQPKKVGITSFTIFPTTDCNARCFYCYELGRSRVHMNDTVAEDVAAYIAKVRQGQDAEICWFGGEPLYNRRAIDIICAKLHNENVPFSSNMITNAFLFDEETARTAKEQWNLKTVQVAMDGTEAIYNKTKAYVGYDGNAFLRVLQNVEFLLKYGMKVVIRLNLNCENEKDLYQLVDVLKNRFTGSRKPSVYVVLLQNFGTDAKQFQNNDEAITACDKLNRYILDRGLGLLKNLRRELIMNKCMADNDHSVTILPDGRLGKCEHESEEKLIGSIYEDTLNQNMIDFWKERLLIPECKSCNLSAACINLKHCAWDNGCTESDRKLKTTNVGRAIYQEYLQWKEK